MQINLTASAQQNNLYYYSSGPQQDTTVKIIVPQHLGNPANAKQDSEYYSVIRNAKTAKIIVSQAYEGTTKIDLPIKEMVAAFLRNAGIEEDTVNNDLTISIVLRGYPLKEAYYHSGTCYSGAVVYCSLNIETIGGEKFSDQFKERVNPPSSIAVGQYKSPDDAPFDEVFTSIKATLLKILYTPYGIEPFLTALTDQKKEITYEVIEALGSLNDKRAVEPLIQFLTLKNNEASALSLNSSNRDFIYSSNDIMVWQRVAVVALGNLGDVRATEPLVLLFEKEKNNHSRAMYNDIRTALIQITGKDYGAGHTYTQLAENEYQDGWLDYVNTYFTGYTIHKVLKNIPPWHDTKGTITYHIYISQDNRNKTQLVFDKDGNFLYKSDNVGIW